MAIQNIVLIGAGGNVGPYILEALDKAGFNTTILSRQSSKSTFSEHKVVRISDTYPYAELVSAFKGQDAVVSTFTSTGDGKLNASGQEAFIDAAIEAGVRRFIPSEFGGDNRNAHAVELSPIYADKLKIVQYLKAREDKISWTAVPTGPFFEFGLKHAFLGIDLKQNTAKIVEGGNNKFSVSTLPQIGEAVAAILKNEKETANRHVAVESFLTSQNELVAILDKQGRQLQVTHQTGQELIQGSQAGVKAGNIFAAYGLIQAANFVPGYGADNSADAEHWRPLLGLQKLDLEAEVQRVVAEIDAGS